MHLTVDGHKYPRRVTPNLKPGEAPALRCDGVHGSVVDPAATGMYYVVRATGEAALRPLVVDVDVQRRVDADGGMQARRRLPRPEANASDELPVLRCRLEWDAPAVAHQLVTLLHPAADVDLQALDG
jgi:hypothetical protein